MVNPQAIQFIVDGAYQPLHPALVVTFRAPISQLGYPKLVHLNLPDRRFLLVVHVSASMNRYGQLVVERKTSVHCGAQHQRAAARCRSWLRGSIRVGE